MSSGRSFCFLIDLASKHLKGFACDSENRVAVGTRSTHINSHRNSHHIHSFFLSKTRGDFRNICENHRAICVDNKVFHVPLTVSKSSLPVFEKLRKGQSIA